MLQQYRIVHSRPAKSRHRKTRKSHPTGSDAHVFAADTRVGESQRRRASIAHARFQVKSLFSRQELYNAHAQRGLGHGGCSDLRTPAVRRELKVKMPSSTMQAGHACLGTTDTLGDQTSPAEPPRHLLGPGNAPVALIH